MTLEEAIQHLEEILADENHNWSCEECRECREEHEQLLSFLKELQEYRFTKMTPKQIRTMLARGGGVMMYGA